jgi:hypothetical protein
MRYPAWALLCFLVGLVALTVFAAGCGATTASKPAATVTVTLTQPTVRPPAPGATRTPARVVSKRPPAVARPSSLQTFDGNYFSVDYSGAWYVETDAADKGSYLDTTIRNPVNRDVMLRIDVTPGASIGDPVVNARQVESALRRQPGYRLLDFSRTSFQGYPAVRWEFEVEEHGTLLRKVDVFFENANGDGFGVLTQAPASTFALWRRYFANTRTSLALTPTTSTPAQPLSPETETVPSLPSEPAQSFCDTHACIPNFDNGVGTVVQCADGMWSHSGGQPGACSYHRGVAGGTRSDEYGYPDTGATEDYGSGNGYPVICADGTLSDSGGIQGACSHHRGVG